VELLEEPFEELVIIVNVHVFLHREALFAGHTIKTGRKGIKLKGEGP